MKSQFIPLKPFSSLFYIVLMIFFMQYSPVFCNNTEWYTSCSNLFNCGGITGVDYPFWGGNRSQECGHPGLELTCDDNIPTIEIMNVTYRVLEINPSIQILRVSRQDFTINDICPVKLVNTTLDSNLFEYASGYVNLTIQYGCPPLNIPVPAQLTCTINGITYQNGYVVPGAQGPGTCRASIYFPILSTVFGGINEDLSLLGQVMDRGFEVRWKVDSQQCNECKNSSGSCGYDLKSNQFTCLCPGDRPSGYYACSNVEINEEQSPQPSTPDSGGINGLSTPISVVLAITGAIIAGVGLGFLIFWCRQRRKRLAAEGSQRDQTESKDLSIPPASKAPATAFTRSTPSYLSSKSEFGKETSYFGVQVFSYNELEKPLTILLSPENLERVALALCTMVFYRMAALLLSSVYMRIISSRLSNSSMKLRS